MKQFNTAIEREDHRDTSYEITTFSANISLTKSSAKEVKTLMRRLLENESRIVNLDMSGLDNLDFWGANQLVKTICCILARGQKFNIWCENLKVRNLLELLRINELAPVLSIDSQTDSSTSLAA